MKEMIEQNKDFIPLELLKNKKPIANFLSNLDDNRRIYNNIEILSYLVLTNYEGFGPCVRVFIVNNDRMGQAIFTLDNISEDYGVKEGFTYECNTEIIEICRLLEEQQ